MRITVIASRKGDSAKPTLAGRMVVEAGLRMAGSVGWIDDRTAIDRLSAIGSAGEGLP